MRDAYVRVGNYFILKSAKLFIVKMHPKLRERGRDLYLFEKLSDLFNVFRAHAVHRQLRKHTNRDKFAVQEAPRVLLPAPADHLVEPVGDREASAGLVRVSAHPADDADHGDRTEDSILQGLTYSVRLRVLIRLRPAAEQDLVRSQREPVPAVLGGINIPVMQLRVS